MESFEEKVREIFCNFHLKPFLFIGAGLSQRYYNLPDWRSLLIDICNKYIEIDNEFAFAQIEYEAEQEIEKRKKMNYTPLYNYDENHYDKKFNTYPIIATILEKKFNNKFYSSGGNFPFELSKNEKESLKTSKYTPFKLLIAKYLEIKKQKTREYNEEIESFKRIEDFIAGVITTNYDDFLDVHLKNFPIYIGQDDLFNAIQYQVGEIYKIHGTLDRPESIILTENDYDKVYERYQYLSAKLLTFFVEHPIVFIGYSLSDKNIKNILSNINKCLSNENKEKLANRLIFIEKTDSEEEQKIIPFQEQESGLMFIKIILKDFNILYNSILEVKDGIPTRIIRLIKDKVATIVKSTDSNKKVYYGSELNNPNVSDDKLVLFIGYKDEVSRFGFIGLRADDLYRDVVFNEDNFDSKQLFELALPIMPYIERSKLPLWKYIKDYGYQENFKKHIIDNPMDVINNSLIPQKYVDDINKCNSIREIIALQLGKRIEISAILYKIESLEINEVEQYLKTNFKYQISNDNNKYIFKKLIVAYDCLKYKNE